MINVPVKKAGYVDPASKFFYCKLFFGYPVQTSLIRNGI